MKGGDSDSSLLLAPSQKRKEEPQKMKTINASVLRDQETDGSYKYQRLAEEEEDNQIEVMEEHVSKEGCLGKMNALDQELSGKIHESSVNKILELVILVFAALFNRVYALSCFLFSYIYAVVDT